MHRVRELQAVHTAGHLNVGKKQRDVGTGLQNGESLIGVDRFHRTESGVLHDADGAHAKHHLVLDDKNVRHCG
jgi:hypothetical protein